MTEARFEALAMWCRNPASRGVLANCGFFSADDERLIGASYYVKEADRFAFILLARDAHGRYQGFANQGIYPSRRAADAAVTAALTGLADEETPNVPMRPDTRVGVDLFVPIAGAKLNAKFLHLRDSRNQSAARELLREIGPWAVDLDGNLVRDFQTTGFDARTWELYLLAAFTELGFGFDRSDAVPDYRLVKDDAKIFVEATTANPTGGREFDIRGAPPPPPDDFWGYIEHEMPQKFGSPLLSKVRKRYWERPEVAGHPFVIALADFHAPASMVWSHTALPLYLYGVGVEVRYREDGSKYGTEKALGDHIVGDKIVPANFFAQPRTEHISAVLFSNAGTISKFNRMGVLAGFGDPEVTIVRKGLVNDPSPDAFEGIPFEFNIEDPAYQEQWADEIEIYHNPRARIPLPHDVFEGVTHFFLEDGELVWRGPSPRILASSSMARAPALTPGESR